LALLIHHVLKGCLQGDEVLLVSVQVSSMTCLLWGFNVASFVVRLHVHRVILHHAIEHIRLELRLFDLILQALNLFHSGRGYFVLLFLELCAVTITTRASLTSLLAWDPLRFLLRLFNKLLECFVDHVLLLLSHSGLL